VLKPKLSSKLSLKELQNWTTKIELNINQSEYKSALSALEEVNDSILGAGFTEEYLRVAELLFNAVEWDVAINLEYPYFHNQFYVLCSVKTQFGRFQSALKDLDQYSQLIHGKSAHYLSYCSETTYCYWYQKSFDKAIQVGEEGEYLLNTSNLADTFNLRHNLALAWRDSLKENNVEKALDYFLKNESLKDILDYTKIKTELGGSFYGNVGRCLEILKKYREALLCYCISYRLLNKETDRHALLNLGYAANWIGDVLSSIDKQLDAATFYQYAINKWRDTSPPRSIDVQAKMDDLVLNESQKSEINDLAEWKVEKNCEKIIGEILGSEP
jgi:tetratricopeptide (TPR) repeat protein